MLDSLQTNGAFSSPPASGRGVAHSASCSLASSAIVRRTHARGGVVDARGSSAARRRSQRARIGAPNAVPRVASSAPRRSVLARTRRRRTRRRGRGGSRAAPAAARRPAPRRSPAGRRAGAAGARGRATPPPAGRPSAARPPGARTPPSNCACADTARPTRRAGRPRTVVTKQLALALSARAAATVSRCRGTRGSAPTSPRSAPRVVDEPVNGGASWRQSAGRGRGAHANASRGREEQVDVYDHGARGRRGGSAARHRRGAPSAAMARRAGGRGGSRVEDPSSMMPKASPNSKQPPKKCALPSLTCRMSSSRSSRRSPAGR